MIIKPFLRITFRLSYYAVIILLNDNNIYIYISLSNIYIKIILHTYLNHFFAF